jgi:hypothetical protein
VTVHSINRRASAHAAPLARAIPLCQKGSRQRAAGTELGRSRKVLRAVAILKLVAVRLKVGVAVRDVRDLDGEIDQSLSQSFEFTASCRVRKHRTWSSPQSEVAAAVHRVSGDDQMVEQRHVEILRDPGEPDCGLDIGLAGGRIAARVVVHEDEAGGPKRVAPIQELPGWQWTAARVAAGDRVDGEQLHFHINVKRQEPLVRFLAERLDVGFHRLPSVNHVPRPEERVRSQVIVGWSDEPALGAAKLGYRSAGHIAPPQSGL